MSKLADLITELCLDGVEYKKLSELFNTRNGYTPSKSNASFWENGTIPWFRMEDIRINGGILIKSRQYVSKEAIKGKPFPANSIIISTSATIGEHALVTVESLANQRFTNLTLKENFQKSFIPKFLYYYCFKLDEYCISHTNKGNFLTVDMNKLNDFMFPLPPLPVQSEIVRILDTFTELTARRKQYEYYRDKILTFTEGVEYKTLGDILTIRNGRSYSDRATGTIPVYGSGGILAYVDSYTYNQPSVLIPRKGSINKLYYVDEPFWNIDTIFYTEINQTLAYPKFVYYSLQKLHLEKLNKAGGVPSLTQEILNKIKIPLPPLPVQSEIVRILDHFDKLCNDLTQGLPAEINARRKQYEYYRDILLTFKPREPTA